MAYRPTPIETPQQRWERAIFPVIAQMAASRELLPMQAELSAATGPGGRLTMEQMDPGYKRSQLAMQEAEMAAQYGAADLARRKALVEEAMLGPRMQEKRAGATRDIASARKMGREMDLDEAMFGPRAGKLEAEARWAGARPGIEGEKLDIEWAKLAQLAQHYKDWYKVSWRKGGGKGKAKPTADEAFMSALEDLATGHKSIVHGGLVDGQYVTEEVTTAAQKEADEFREMVARLTYEELAKEDPEKARQRWLDMLKDAGFEDILRSNQRVRAGGPGWETPVPTPAVLIKMRTRPGGGISISRIKSAMPAAATLTEQSKEYKESAAKAARDAAERTRLPGEIRKGRAEILKLDEASKEEAISAQRENIFNQLLETSGFAPSPAELDRAVLVYRQTLARNRAAAVAELERNEAALEALNAPR